MTQVGISPAEDGFCKHRSDSKHVRSEGTAIQQKVQKTMERKRVKNKIPVTEEYFRGYIVTKR